MIRVPFSMGLQTLIDRLDNLVHLDILNQHCDIFGIEKSVHSYRHDAIMGDISVIR